MELVLVGSFGYDTISTQHGTVEDTLGGAAVHAGLAASRVLHQEGRVGLVSVVGEDVNPSDLAILQSRNIDLTGIETLDGQTFRWAGRYEGTMDQAETLSTDLNVLQEFNPRVPEEWRSAPYLFCANIHPAIQASVIQQMESPTLVAVDSMNLWIDIEREALSAVLRRADIVFLNEAEVRMFADEPHLVLAMRAVRDGSALSGGSEAGSGPQILVAKKGEHGLLMIADGYTIAMPAYPSKDIIDPTGCGDTFAGTVMACLTENGVVKPTEQDFRDAMIHATVAASFVVGGFGTAPMVKLDRGTYHARLDRFRRIIGI